MKIHWGSIRSLVTVINRIIWTVLYSVEFHQLLLQKRLSEFQWFATELPLWPGILFYLPSVRSQRWGCESRVDCYYFPLVHWSIPETTAVSDALCCPITSCVFEDPVLAEDGITYERHAITQWILQNATSPMTRQPLSLTNLRPNYAIRNLINELHSANAGANSSTARPSHTIRAPSERAAHTIPHCYSLSPSRSHYNEKCNNKQNQRRRVALLFGNDSYMYENKLECCVNDAHAMSMALSSLDFECALACNMRKQEMEDQLAIFGRRIQANDCVLVFFSGHGGEKNVSATGRPLVVPLRACEIWVYLHRFSSTSDSSSTVKYEAWDTYAYNDSHYPVTPRSNFQRVFYVAVCDRPQSTLCTALQDHKTDIRNRKLYS